MDNSLNQTKKESTALNQLASSRSGSESYIYEQILGVLKIDINDNTPIEYMNCTTVTGIVSSYILNEQRRICSMAEVSCSQIAYEDIKAVSNTIEERIKYYSSVSEFCEKIRDDFSLYHDKGCPIDDTLKIENNGLVWLTTLSAEKALVWYESISCATDLLNAIICKFNYLGHQCQLILDVRETLSDNPQSCAIIYEHHLSIQEPFIIIAAQKAIEDADLTTSTKKYKYITKKLCKYNANELSEPFQDKEKFASFIANTEGVSSSTVFDFLVDYYILKQICNGALEYPWLNEEMHNQINDIMLLLNDCYKALRRKGYSSVRAYAVIYVWMRDHIKIATENKRHAILKFTQAMNEQTNEMHDKGSISNEISKLKDNKPTEVFIVLDVFAGTYGIKCNV